VPLVAALLAGTGLRVFHLERQVLEGDDLHAVRAAVTSSVGKILTTYREADISLPLTALDRALIDGGFTLTETSFRLPSVLAGIAALLLLPLLLARQLPGGPPRGLAALYAWLLALSPILFFASRTDRPYMPVALFSVLAVAAFLAWWRTGGLRFAFLYVAAGAFAVWLHLGAAPFVAAPFFCAAVELFLPAAVDRARRLRRLALLALALLGVFAAFLLPAWHSLMEIVAAKRQAQSVPLQTWGRMLVLQAGTAQPVLAVFFWLAALAGLWRLFAADRRLAAWTLTLAAVQVVGIRLLSPLGLADPLIFDRYVIPVVPLVLLWVAAAFALPWPGEGKTGRAVRRLAGFAFVLVLGATGPFADPALWRSSFMHHRDFVAFFAPRPALAPEDAPDFYGSLAASPGRRRQALIEYPWYSPGLRCLHLYQQIHRRRVIVSGPERQLTAPGLAFENFVAARPRAFCASGAAYLVVHLHIAREEDEVDATGMARENRQGLRLLGEDMAANAEALWGEPSYADSDLRVWDLDRVCALHPIAPAAGADAWPRRPPP
jgi:hypothetical protein